MSEFISSNIAALSGIGILLALFIFLLTIWSIIWKGFALWIAAQEKNKPWFIGLLILNTAGILEIVYIFFISKKGKEVFSKWKQKHIKPKGNMGAENEAPKTPEEN